VVYILVYIVVLLVGTNVVRCVPDWCKIRSDTDNLMTDSMKQEAMKAQGPVIIRPPLHLSL
jgi:hypothetical protein